VDLRTVGSIGVLGAEMSLEGGAASGIAECPQREERLREWLSIFRRKSNLRIVFGVSQLREDARTFFLGLQLVFRNVEFVTCSEYS